tara:strand:- start:64680 stop:65549 length:870 start_codon:yes stop_codon:yes gene_type:complete
MLLTRSVLQTVRQIAERAGREILAVYSHVDGPQVQLKADDSPLTEADLRANRVIVSELRRNFPDIPVLSEESEPVPFSTRRRWQSYWLVDPLDGTKEFLSRNGEFTVNIALINDGDPVMGIVHVPVTGVTYAGLTQGSESGAWRYDGGIEDPEEMCEGRSLQATELPSPAQWPELTLRVVASRRHGGEQSERLLAMMRARVGDLELVNMGSSLKMCLIAEGKADFYPRLAPTSEWDTAAAHAVLKAAGGKIVNTGMQVLRYNTKESTLNPHFYALAGGDGWDELLEGVR